MRLCLTAGPLTCGLTSHAGAAGRSESGRFLHPVQAQPGFCPAAANRKRNEHMALPEFSMRQLLEAGAHFGHQTHRWNPKMDRYIFGARSNIHIIDLSQTVPLLHQALVKVREVAAGGGRVLFVGTKRQASEPIADAAKRCAQYYVNHRWLGGTLTNWRTISNSITRLRELEGMLDGERRASPRRSCCSCTRERDKLERVAGRHQGHGRHPRPDVRDRHQQGSDRDPGSPQAGHPGRRHPRHQLRSGRHHLSRSRATTTPRAPSSSTAT